MLQTVVDLTDSELRVLMAVSASQRDKTESPSLADFWAELLEILDDEKRRRRDQWRQVQDALLDYSEEDDETAWEADLG